MIVHVCAYTRKFSKVCLVLYKQISDTKLFLVYTILIHQDLKKTERSFGQHNYKLKLFKFVFLQLISIIKINSFVRNKSNLLWFSTFIYYTIKWVLVLLNLTRNHLVIFFSLYWIIDDHTIRVEPIEGPLLPTSIEPTWFWSSASKVAGLQVHGTYFSYSNKFLCVSQFVVSCI